MRGKNAKIQDCARVQLIVPLLSCCPPFSSERTLSCCVLVLQINKSTTKTNYGCSYLLTDLEVVHSAEL